MRNPLAFAKWPVTVVVAAVYVGLLAGLLYVHHVVPAAPRAESPVAGVNVTEAWRDLQQLTDGFHPYNSRRNDEVRDWLLRRVEAILADNEVKFETEQSYGVVDPTSVVGSVVSSDGESDVSSIREPKTGTEKEAARVVIFNDMQSNCTTSANSTLSPPLSVYFEGTNIIVYVKGSGDSREPWWRTADARPPDSNRAFMVNAHYDSVSTGYGATDDGVGVVSILQLIRHFTTKGNQPRRGFIALLNNGEEDYLNGAWAFLQHPISRLADSFLNLEGAGAGGRAALFRSTDAEVTRYYKKAPHPFGSAVTADSFNRGLVRSQTDYVVFNGVGGLRGLDVAFLEPRSRYHTIQDSTKDTSRDSLWHMLSAALAVTRAMAADNHTDLSPDAGSDGVWFDVFGRGFGLMSLQDLFALSVSLLVLCPLVVILILVVLRRFDRQYLFTANHVTDPHDPRAPDEATVIGLGGWRGFTRFPIAFVVSTAVVVGIALGLAKANPYIVYSSPYAVWATMLSAWTCVAWFFLRGASFMRPSALHRAHSLTWLFVLFWVLAVGATVGEKEYGLAGGYFIVIYFAAVFVAVALSYLEMFFLPRRSHHVQSLFPAPEYGDDASIASRSRSRGRRRPQSASAAAAAAAAAETDAEDVTETTSLLSARPKKRVIGGGSSTQPDTGATADADGDNGDSGLTKVIAGVFGEEQAWSARLPSGLWVLQFLAVAPVALVLVGQIGLLLTSGLAQTLADGSSALNVYLCLAVLSVLLVLPAAPFVHRLNRKLPLFLLLVCVGCLVYSLAAFPFSEANRLKVYFLQQVDVDTGLNRVTLTGLPEYIEAVVRELPSSQGQVLECGPPSVASRKELLSCSWPGLAPDVVPAEEGVPVVARRSAEGKSSGISSSTTLSSTTSSSKSSSKSSSSSKSKSRSSSSHDKHGTSSKSTSRDKHKTTSSSSTTSSHQKATSTAVPSTTDALLPPPTYSPGPPTLPLPPPLRYAHYLAVAANRTSPTTATIAVRGRSTRSCKLLFDGAVTSFHVHGAAPAYSQPQPPHGTREIRLWSRTWDREWLVDVVFAEPAGQGGGGGGLDGAAVCNWSEWGAAGAQGQQKIAALDEVRRFAPRWAVVSKYSDGLVEGRRAFRV